MRGLDTNEDAAREDAADAKETKQGDIFYRRFASHWRSVAQLLWLMNPRKPRPCLQRSPWFQRVALLSMRECSSTRRVLKNACCRLCLDKNFNVYFTTQSHPEVVTVHRIDTSGHRCGMDSMTFPRQMTCAHCSSAFQRCRLRAKLTDMLAAAHILPGTLIRLCLSYVVR